MVLSLFRVPSTGTQNATSGEMMFKLDKAQVWQLFHAYVYHYAYRPQVFIYRSGPLHKMRRTATTVQS